ncbi:hypothetical protein J2X46_001578 [Nocardioides sp. BE266]|uniref:hypothetical protein n=1 Tax=Nocardioides sp. BE266 TaxID=2817725 RepID=UPI00285B32A7|nr:hypothetical protein [Nocardioides sp. BE266]MDR7252602.1 hypothetical protein [Nocardioides sp. BE266]
MEDETALHGQSRGSQPLRTGRVCPVELAQRRPRGTRQQYDVREGPPRLAGPVPDAGALGHPRRAPQVSKRRRQVSTAQCHQAERAFACRGDRCVAGASLQCCARLPLGRPGVRVGQPRRTQREL